MTKDLLLVKAAKQRPGRSGNLRPGSYFILLLFTVKNNMGRFPVPSEGILFVCTFPCLLLRFANIKAVQAKNELRATDV